MYLSKSENVKNWIFFVHFQSEFIYVIVKFIQSIVRACAGANTPALPMIREKRRGAEPKNFSAMPDF